MNEELDYAQMLEIPVNTINVVKKSGAFKKKSKAKDKEKDDLKQQVLDSVNERIEVGEEQPYDFLRTENISDVPKENVAINKDKGGAILFVETVAACLIAGGIFITNIFLPNSAINTFVNGLTATTPEEAAYNELTLSSVVSELSDAEVSKTYDGVICFTDKTLVYPVCDGEIASVAENDGLYTVKIAHTSTFSSVITGLSQVYSEVGESVASNLPFAYSGGENEVRVSMYDGETLLNCYTLSGVVPVWNS